MPCQDLSQSMTTQQLGITMRAARACTGAGPGGQGGGQGAGVRPVPDAAYASPRSRNHAAAPTPAQGAPSTITTSRSAGPRFGVSQYSAMKRYPAPNHQPRTAASRQVGAARISSSPGTRPNQARNSRFSEPKASTGKPPASKPA